MSTDAQDLAAHNEWLDGEGEQCATTTGIWFAALQYERARVAKLTTPAKDLTNHANALQSVADSMQLTDNPEMLRLAATVRWIAADLLTAPPPAPALAEPAPKPFIIRGLP